MSLTQVLAAIDSAGGPQSFAVIGAVARNAWAPPRATTDLDVSVVARADVLASITAALEALGGEDIRAVLRTQERAGHRLDWAYIERWASFWQITDRLARIRPKQTN